MSIISIPTPFNIDLEFRIAPFYKRLVAWIVDLLVLAAYILLMVRFVFSGIGGSYLVTALFIVIVVLPVMLYHLVLEVLLNGQSVGKKIFGIRVISKDGDKATFSQFLLRWIFRLIDMGVFCIVALFTAALTVYTQRLGDLVAGTIVIDDKYKANVYETIYLDIDDKAYKPMFPQVMQLSDRDINGIRNLLDIKRSSRDLDNYTLQVTARIKEVLQLDTPMDGREFLHRLLQDYNYLTRK